MDSSTVGIPRNSPGGYYQRVNWSVRISNSGEFVHAAPWSTGAQGSGQRLPRLRQPLHRQRAWYFRLTRRGGLGRGQGLASAGSGLGVADWNMSWSKWLAGSALPR